MAEAGGCWHEGGRCRVNLCPPAPHPDLTPLPRISPDLPGAFFRFNFSRFLVEAFVVDELGGVEPADYKAEPRA